MSLDFSQSDLATLSLSTGLSVDVLVRRLSQIRLHEFKTPELKELLKFVRTHPAYANNPYCSRQVTGPLSSLTKKAQQVDALKNILQFQLASPQQQQQQQQQVAANTYQTNGALAAAAGMSSAAQLHQQQQAAYRTMQAQQAARYQPPQDPYSARYGAAAAASAAARPSYAQSAYAQPQQPQQYGYANGNVGTHDPYGMQRSQYLPQHQQQHLPTHQQQQQHQQPPQGYYHPQASAVLPTSTHSHSAVHRVHGTTPHSSSAAAAPTGSSAPYQSAAARAAEIAALCADPAFQSHRSPYEFVVASLAKNLLNASSASPEKAHQPAVQNGSAYFTSLQFNIDREQFQRLKRAGNKSPPYPPPPGKEQLEVHLRLFSSLPPPLHGHTAWGKSFRVTVNGSEVVIPDARKLSKSKKKGLELVRALDLSEQVAPGMNQVEVSVYRGGNYATDMFRGMVTADLVRLRDTSELMEIQEKIKKEAESKKQATALQRHCIICQSTRDPLRCSRCKAEWYCLADDQQILTSAGFMFRDEFLAKHAEAASGSAVPLLRVATYVHEDGSLVYAEPSAVIDKEAGDDMVEFTHEAEAGRWASDADQYGRTQAKAEQAREGVDAVPADAAVAASAQEDDMRSNGLSMRVTATHTMLVRMGLADASRPAASPDWRRVSVTGEDGTESSAIADYGKLQAGELISLDPLARIQMRAAAPKGQLAPPVDHLTFIRQLDLQSEVEIAAFLELYGYWLGAGCLHVPSGAVAFGSRRSEEWTYLDGLFQQLQRVLPHQQQEREQGWWIETQSDSDSDEQRTYLVSNPEWCTLFAEQCGQKGAVDNNEHTNHFSSWVWSLGQMHARHVLSGMRRATEGSFTAVAGQQDVFTSSARIRDDVIRLALHAGYSAHFHVVAPPGSLIDTWRVSCADASDDRLVSLTEPVLHSARDVRAVSSSTYTGRTWCVTVPSGFIFTRRALADARGVVTKASRTTIVGNCSQEHQKQHWPAHRLTCVAPTPEQDAARESAERKAAQQAMLGANGRTKLQMPVKKEPGNGADSDLEEGVEEVDSLVSLKCPLSLERYEFPARGKHCAHLPCFNLETFLMFSQQSGVWQCPVCYKPLPWEDLEVDLNMLSVIRETADCEPEVTQIRVAPDGQYDIVSTEKGAGDETGDGRDPSSRKRKQPASSPPPPAQRPATGDGINAAGAPQGTATWLPANGHVDSARTASPATSPIAAAGASMPASSPAPVADGPAGTADEPIELD